MKPQSCYFIVVKSLLSEKRILGGTKQCFDLSPLKPKIEFFVPFQKLNIEVVALTGLHPGS